MYSIIYGGVSSTLREKGDTAQAVKADSVARAVQWNISPDAY
jgi:hypothetical protein